MMRGVIVIVTEIGMMRGVIVTEIGVMRGVIVTEIGKAPEIEAMGANGIECPPH